jgi:hypothetical protein
MIRTYEVINQLAGIENLSYLELGIGDARNVRYTKCKNKTSVDTSDKFNPTYVMTTDEYFERNQNETFDIIFIDANHDFDYALRDLNNSMSRCHKFIMMHDMVPPTLRHTNHHNCSDSYKILYYLLKETNLEVLVLNQNFGLTFIKMPAEPITIPEQYQKASYEEFMQFLKTKKIYSPEDIIKELEKWLA